VNVELNALAMSSKNKNIKSLQKGIYEFKTGYKPRSIVIWLQIPMPLVTDPSPSEVEITTAKLNKYKLPGSDQYLAKMI
jgi:hypothetical protein